MPESRHRYLYERLGDHDFQQLVNGLFRVGGGLGVTDSDRVGD